MPCPRRGPLRQSVGARFRGRIAFAHPPIPVQFCRKRACWGERPGRLLQGICFATPGIHRIEAVSTDRRPAALLAAANPVRVTAERPPQKLLWGDLHGHTLLSDGRGTVEEYYDFAEHVAGLEIPLSRITVSTPTQMWRHCKAVTMLKPARKSRHHQRLRVERHDERWRRSQRVLPRSNYLPIYRCTTLYNPQPANGHDAGMKSGSTVEELLARLGARLKHKDVFCIPHFGGRPAMFAGTIPACSD